MTGEIIITVCILLLLAYLFDISSKFTKIPSVILLLLLGWLVRQLSGLLNVPIPDLNPLLPIFGTVGLILIVLEGSLELEYDRSKIPLIKKSVIVALLPMLIMGFGLAFCIHYFEGYSFKDSLVNTIPFCVISSAIAIPSAGNLNPFNKEFVIYETSLSDIMGVVFFNFFALNSTISAITFGEFAMELAAILIVSFIATMGLSLLLNKINHHIKFGPIIILILLIYEISKIYHLPALIFILLFGLFLNNLEAFKRYRWIEMLQPEKLNKEVHQFKEIATEAAFLIRALFFILFGFLMETSEIINPDTLLWAGIIVVSIFLTRFIFLKMAKMDLSPLLFIAPRGLITILLFFSILPEQRIPLVNKSLIIQVILISAIIMMLGVMSTKRKTKKPEKPKTK